MTESDCGVLVERMAELVERVKLLTARVDEVEATVRAHCEVARKVPWPDYPDDADPMAGEKP